MNYRCVSKMSILISKISSLVSKIFDPDIEKKLILVSKISVLVSKVSLLVARSTRMENIDIGIEKYRY